MVDPVLRDHTLSRARYLLLHPAHDRKDRRMSAQKRILLIEDNDASAGDYTR